MRNSVTYPILRHMLGYTKVQQLRYLCHLMTHGVQVHSLLSWHECFQWCYQVYACVIEWSTS
jgi:hypothetical protein